MLKEYVEKFNENDEEFIKNEVANSDALEFLEKYAPKLSCPDKVIEETFAFRCWTLRKHLRKTEENGLVLSEFLPKVSWSDKNNVITAPFGFHMKESRWFGFADELIYYVDYVLRQKVNPYNYFTPAIPEIVAFLKVTGNEWYIKENISCFEEYYKGWEDRHLLPCGLFVSDDWRDAMEFSISASTSDGIFMKGVRPTLNSYMYENAVVMAQIERGLGEDDKADLYQKKADNIQKLVNERLFDGDFYKAVHTKNKYYRVGDWDEKTDENAPNINEVTYKDLDPDYDVKELIGYLPWATKLAPKGREKAFKYLKDEKVFKAKTGFSTADMSHERFLFMANHECLWNGYVWPFATTQTINAVISLLDNYDQKIIDNNDLYDFIKTYAEMHYVYIDGKKKNFIDEMMHPFKHEWTTRETLKNWGWREDKGGYERGKDYNHSCFVDLIIRGLCGVDENAKTLTVNPKIKGIWKWFKLQIPFRKKTYDIYYDEDGTHFNKGKGVIIEEIG